MLRRLLIASVVALSMTLFSAPTSARAADEGGGSSWSWSWSWWWSWWYGEGGWNHHGEGGQNGGTTPRDVPEFDPSAAGAVAAVLAGGGLLIARRKKA